MKKYSLLTAAVGLLLALVVTAAAGAAETARGIREKTLRLHIVANSDSYYDQQLKFKVRDALLAGTTDFFADCADKSEALRAAVRWLPEMRAVAQRTVAEAGCDYGVRVSLTRMQFDETPYDSFTMPAGMYDALRVEIGDAAGKNWFCVLYPALCVAGCGGEEEAKECYDDSERFMLKSPYRVRLRSVDWLRGLKKPD